MFERPPQVSNIKEFNYEEYFIINSNPPDPSIELKTKGILLLTQYYADKYAAKITIPQHLGVADSLSRFIKSAPNYLADFRNAQGENRQAFLIGIMSGHGIPIIFIKDDKNEEGILLADSKGTSSYNALQLQESLGIPVYAVKKGRQRDGFSCYADALIIGCECTARNISNGEYRIPNLLQQLKSRSTNLDNYHVTLLPDNLLKTSQLSDFTKEHKEPNNPIIHKNETLTDFRKRYTNEFAHPTYLRAKGVKFADIIEIQFYLNQLKEKVGTKLTEIDSKLFIEESKKILKSQGAPFEPEEENETSTSRKGLHEFTQTFLGRIIDQQKSQNPNPTFFI